MIFNDLDQENKKPEQKKEEQQEFDLSLVGKKPAKEQEETFDLSKVKAPERTVVRKASTSPLDIGWANGELEDLAKEFGISEFNSVAYKRLGEELQSSDKKIDELGLKLKTNKTDAQLQEDYAKETVRNLKLRTLYGVRAYNEKEESFEAVDERLGKAGKGVGAALEAKRNIAAARWAPARNEDNNKNLKDRIKMTVVSAVGNAPSLGSTGVPIPGSGLTISAEEIYEGELANYVDKVNEYLKSRGDENTYESVFGKGPVKISKILSAPSGMRIARFGDKHVGLETEIRRPDDYLLRPFVKLVAKDSNLTTEQYTNYSSALWEAKTPEDRRRWQRALMSDNMPEEFLSGGSKPLTKEQWMAAKKSDDALLDSIWSNWNTIHGAPQSEKPAYIGYTYANSAIIDITDLQSSVGDEFIDKMSERHFAAFLSPGLAKRAASIFSPTKDKSAYRGETYVRSYQEALENSSALNFQGDRVYISVGSSNPELWQARLTALRMGGTDEQIRQNALDIHASITSKEFQQLYHQEVMDSYAKAIISGKMSEGIISTLSIAGSDLVNFAADRLPSEQIQSTWNLGLRMYKDGRFTKDDLASLGSALRDYAKEFGTFTGGAIGEARISSLIQLPSGFDLSSAKVNSNSPRVQALVATLVDGKAQSEMTSNSLDFQRTNAAGLTDAWTGTRRIIQPSKSYVQNGEKFEEVASTGISAANFNRMVAPFVAVMTLGSVTGGLAPALGLGTFGSIALSTGVITTAQGAQIWRQTRYASPEERVNATAEMVVISLALAGLRAGTLRFSGNQAAASIGTSAAEGLTDLPSFLDISNETFYQDVQKKDEFGKPMVDSLGRPIMEKQLIVSRVIQEKLLQAGMAWVDWGKDIPESVRANRANFLTSVVGFTNGNTHVVLNYDTVNRQWSSTVITPDNLDKAKKSVAFQTITNDEMVTIQSALNQGAIRGLIGLQANQTKLHALGLTDATAVYWNSSTGKFANINEVTSEFGVTNEDEIRELFSPENRANPLRLDGSQTSWGMIDGHSVNSIISTLDSIGVPVDLSKHAIVSDSGQSAIDTLVQQGLVANNGDSTYSLTEEGSKKASEIKQQREELGAAVRDAQKAEIENYIADRNSKPEDWIKTKTQELKDLGYSDNEILAMSTDVMAKISEGKIERSDYDAAVGKNPSLSVGNKARAIEFSGRDEQSKQAADKFLGRLMGTDNRPLFLDASELANLSDVEKEALAIGLKSNALVFDQFGNITNSKFVVSYGDTKINFGINGYESMLTFKWAVADRTGNIEEARKAAKELADYRGEDVNSESFKNTLNEDADYLLARTNNFESKVLDLSGPLKSKLSSILKERIGDALVRVADEQQKATTEGAVIKTTTQLGTPIPKQKVDVKSLRPIDFNWSPQVPAGDLGDVVSVKGSGRSPSVYTRNASGNYVNAANTDEVITEQQLRDKVAADGLQIGTLKPTSNLSSTDSATLEKTYDKAADKIGGKTAVEQINQLMVSEANIRESEQSMDDGVGKVWLTSNLAVEIDSTSLDSPWNGITGEAEFVQDPNLPGAAFVNAKMFSILMYVTTGGRELNPRGIYGVANMADIVATELARYRNDRNFRSRMSITANDLIVIDRMIAAAEKAQKTGNKSMAFTKLDLMDLDRAQHVASGKISAYRKLTSTLRHEYIHKLLIDRIGDRFFMSNPEFLESLTNKLINTRAGRELLQSIADKAASDYADAALDILENPDASSISMAIIAHEILAHSSDIESLESGLGLEDSDIDNYVEVLYNLHKSAEEVDPNLAQNIKTFADPELSEALEAYHEANRLESGLPGPGNSSDVAQGTSLEENQGASLGNQEVVPADPEADDSRVILSRELAERVTAKQGPKPDLILANGQDLDMLGAPNEVQFLFKTYTGNGMLGDITKGQDPYGMALENINSRLESLQVSTDEILAKTVADEVVETASVTSHYDRPYSGSVTVNKETGIIKLRAPQGPFYEGLDGMSVSSVEEGLKLLRNAYVNSQFRSKEAELKQSRDWLVANPVTITELFSPARDLGAELDPAERARVIETKMVAARRFLKSVDSPTGNTGLLSTELIPADVLRDPTKFGLKTDLVYDSLTDTYSNYLAVALGDKFADINPLKAVDFSDVLQARMDAAKNSPEYRGKDLMSPEMFAKWAKPLIDSGALPESVQKNPAQFMAYANELKSKGLGTPWHGYASERFLADMAESIKGLYPNVPESLLIKVADRFGGLTTEQIRESFNYETLKGMNNSLVTPLSPTTLTNILRNNVEFVQNARRFASVAKQQNDTAERNSRISLFSKETGSDADILSAIVDPVDGFYDPVAAAVFGFNPKDITQKGDGKLAKVGKAPGKQWYDILSRIPGIKKVNLDWGLGSALLSPELAGKSITLDELKKIALERRVRIVRAINSMVSVASPLFKGWKPIKFTDEARATNPELISDFEAVEAEIEAINKELVLATAIEFYQNGEVSPDFAEAMSRYGDKDTQRKRERVLRNLLTEKITERKELMKDLFSLGGLDRTKNLLQYGDSEYERYWTTGPAVSTFEMTFETFLGKGVTGVAMNVNMLPPGFEIRKSGEGVVAVFNREGLQVSRNEVDEFGAMSDFYKENFLKYAGHFNGTIPWNSNVAHIRGSVRMVEGKPVVFLDELQSDLVSKMSDRGVLTQEEYMRYKDLERMLNDMSDFEQMLPVEKADLFKKIREFPGELTLFANTFRNGVTDESIAAYNEAVKDKSVHSKEMAALLSDPDAEFRSMLAKKISYETVNIDTLPILDQVGITALDEYTAFFPKVFGKSEDSGQRLAYPAVPDSPVNDVWVEFLMRASVKAAVSKNMDTIIWTTGAAQTERYTGAMKAVIDTIEYEKFVVTDLEAEFSRLFNAFSDAKSDYAELVNSGKATQEEQDAKLAELEDLQRQMDTNTYKLGRVTDPITGKRDDVIVVKTSRAGKSVSQEIYPGDADIKTPGKRHKNSLKDLFGADMANKIISGGTGKIEGDEILMGGQFYEQIYDQMAVSGAKKVLGKDAQINKKYLNPETGKLSDSPGKDLVPVWVAKIPEGVRTTSKAGMSLYSRETVPQDRKGLKNEAKDLLEKGLMSEDTGVQSFPADLTVLDGFYSNIEAALMGLNVTTLQPASKRPPARAIGKDWLNIIAKTEGIKKEEMEWTGLTGFLEENATNSLSVNDILAYIRTNKIYAETKYYIDSRPGLDIDPDVPADSETKLKWPGKLAGGLKFGIEMVMTIPNFLRGKTSSVAQIFSEADLPKGYKIVRIGQSRYNVLNPNNQVVAKYRASNPDEVADLFMNERAPVLNPKYYNTVHWDDANVALWVRGSVREVNGEKVFYMEETQSDIHQKGREQGYFDVEVAKQKKSQLNALLGEFNRIAESDVIAFPGDTTRFSSQTDTMGNAMAFAISVKQWIDGTRKDYGEVDGSPAIDIDWQTELKGAYEMEVFNTYGVKIPDFVLDSWSETDRFISAIEEMNVVLAEIVSLGKEIDATENASTEIIPAAPFSENWVDVAVKRAIHEAARQGATKFMWTTGKNQVDRNASEIRANMDSLDYEIVGGGQADPTIVATVSRLKATKKKLEDAAQPQFDKYSDLRLQAGVTRTRAGLAITPEQGANLLEAADKLDREVAELKESVDFYKNQINELDKTINNLVSSVSPEKKVKLTGTKNGSVTFLQTISLDKPTVIEGQTVTLESILGKEMATVIRNSEKPTGNFSGDQITVGGEFYSLIYDRKVTKAAEKILKKYGVKATKETVDLGVRAPKTYEIGENGISLSELRNVLNNFRGVDVSAKMEFADGSTIVTSRTTNWVKSIDEISRQDAQGLLKDSERPVKLEVEFNSVEEEVWTIELPQEAQESAAYGFSLYSKETSAAASAQAEEIRRGKMPKAARVEDVSMIDPENLTFDSVQKIINEGNYLLMEGNFGSSLTNLRDLKIMAARFGLKVVEVDGFWEGKKSKAVFVYGPKADSVKNLGIHFAKQFGEDAIVFGSKNEHSLIWPKPETNYTEKMPGKTVKLHRKYPETKFGTIISLPDGTFIEFALTGTPGPKQKLDYKASDYGFFHTAARMIKGFFGNKIYEINELIGEFAKSGKGQFVATGKRDSTGRLTGNNPVTAFINGKPEIVGYAVTREGSNGELQDYLIPVDYLSDGSINREWIGKEHRLMPHGNSSYLMSSRGRNLYEVNGQLLEFEKAMEELPLNDRQMERAMEKTMTPITEGPDKGKFKYRRKVYASGAEAIADGKKPNTASVEKEWKEANGKSPVERPVRAVMYTDEKGIPSVFNRALIQSMFDTLNPFIVKNRMEMPDDMNSFAGGKYLQHSTQLVANYFRELVIRKGFSADNMSARFMTSFFGEGFAKGIKALQAKFPEFKGENGDQLIAMMVGAFSIKERISNTVGWTIQTMAEMSSKFDDDGKLIPDSDKKAGIHGPRIVSINQAYENGLVPYSTFEGVHPEYRDDYERVEIQVGTSKAGKPIYREFFKSPLLTSMQEAKGKLEGLNAYLNHNLPGTSHVGAQYMFGQKGGAMVAAGMTGLNQAHADDLHVFRHIATILGFNVKFTKNENGETSLVMFNDTNIPSWMKKLVQGVYDTIQATTGVPPLVLNQLLVYGPAIDANDKTYASSITNDLPSAIRFMFSKMAKNVIRQFSPELADALETTQKENFARDIADLAEKGMEAASRERYVEGQIFSRDRDSLQAQQDILAQTDEALTNMDPDAWIAVAERLVTHNKLADTEKQAIRLLAEKGNKDDLQKYVLALSNQSVFELFVNVGRVSLLLGLKNIQKNLGGNTLRQFMDELSRVPASILDFVFISLNKAIGGKNTDRSVTSVITDPTATLDAWKFALGKGLSEGGKQFIDILRGDNADVVFEHPSLFRERTTGVKLLKPLEIFEKYGWRFQGAMDRPFNAVAYYRTLHELQTMRMREEHKKGNMISFEDAEEYLTVGDAELAEMYSLQATYQKKNPVANKYYEIVDGLPPTWRAIVSNIFKFVKTPLNVVDYVLDYTGIWQIAKLAHREYGTADWVSWKSSVKRVLDNPQDRKILSMAVSQGAIGTIMTYIGYAMAQAGLLMPWFDREEKKEGEQMEAKGTSWGEAIIGGRSVDISWLSPNSFYLMMGATMFSVDDTFQRRMEDLTDKLNKAKEGGDPEAIERAEQELEKHRNSGPKQEMFSRIFKNFALQTPFLRQLDEIKTTYDQNKLPGGLVEKWFSPGVYVPAIVKEIARTKDEFERVVGDTGLEEKFTETVQANIPSLPGVRRAGKALEDTGLPGLRNVGKIMQGREALPAKVDMFGRPIRTGSGLEATGAVAVNQDFLTKEMDRLNVSISKPTGATTKEINRLREQKGKLFTPYLQSVVDSEGYKKSDDKTKKRILEQTIRFVGESDNLRKLNTEEQNHNLRIISDREYYRNQLRNNPSQFAREVIITDKDTVKAFVSAGLPSTVTFNTVLEDIKKSGNFDQWVNSKFNYEFTVNDRQPIADAQRNYEEFQSDPQAYIINLWARDKRAQESRDRNQDLRQKLFDEGKTKEQVEKELRKQSNRRGVETRRKLANVKQIKVTR